MKDCYTIPGKTYSVHSSSGCTVSDDSGWSKTLEAPEDYFTAHGGKVYLSDDSASVRELFKLAPQQQLALLGVLGGNDGLPMGYTRLGYLEGTGTQLVNTGIVKVGEYRAICEYAGADVMRNGYWFGWKYSVDNVNYQNLFQFYGTSFLGRFTHDSTYGYILPLSFNEQGYIGTDRNRLESTGLPNKVVLNGNVVELSGYAPIKQSNENPNKEPVRLWFMQGVKIYSFGIFNDTAHDIEYIPTLDPTGTPCMFDTVTKTPFYNSGSGAFIAGVETQTQLNNMLRKLPDRTGLEVGTLQVRLAEALQTEANLAALDAMVAKNWEISQAA